MGCDVSEIQLAHQIILPFKDPNPSSKHGIDRNSQELQIWDAHKKNDDNESSTFNLPTCLMPDEDLSRSRALPAHIVQELR